MHGGGDGTLGAGRIRLRASTSLDEPNIMMDDQKETEKWEHLEELCLWMKHVVGQAFFVSSFGLLLLGSFC